jgi:hypothetical protein
MVHSTESPAASQSATAHSDCFTFLRSAFITGLKAYGASLMVIAPSETSQAQSCLAAPGPVTRNHSVAKQQQKPTVHISALRRSPIARPEWKHAEFRRYPSSPRAEEKAPCQL